MVRVVGDRLSTPSSSIGMLTDLKNPACVPYETSCKVGSLHTKSYYI